MQGETPPGMLLPTRRKAMIMAAVMLALFLAALDQTIVAVALPKVVADLGGLDLFAWPLTSYLLASTVVFPVVGRLSDMYGRKPFLLIGIVVFLIGSALAGLAGTMSELIGFRAVQGLGAGLIMANAFAVLGDLFSPAERGRWIGLFAAVWALASVIGPLAGGTITDELSWRWVFFINIPVGALAIPFVLWQLPWFRSGIKGRIDYLGSALLVAGAVPLMLALSWAGNQFGWGEFPVVLSFALAGVFIVGFIYVQARMGDDAVLPLALFRNRVFLVATAVAMIVGVVLFSAAQFIPLFLQGAQGATATNSGLVTLPFALAFVAASVVGGQAVSRTGRFRPIALFGGGLVVSGCLLIWTLDLDSSKNLTRGYMAVLGVGLGLVMPMFALAVQNAVPYRLLGVASASNQFFRQIAGTMGVAIFGSVMVTQFASRLSAAFPTGLEELKQTPQILLDSERLESFRASVEADDPGTSVAVVRAAQEALGSSVTDLFLVAAILSAVAVGFILLTPKVRMRTRDDLLGTKSDADSDAPPPASPDADIAAESAAEPVAEPAAEVVAATVVVDQTSRRTPLPVPVRVGDDGLPVRAGVGRRSAVLSAAFAGLVLGLLAAIVPRDEADGRGSSRRRTLLSVVGDARREIARALATEPPPPPPSRTERLLGRIDDALYAADESETMASLRAGRRQARRTVRTTRRRLADTIDVRRDPRDGRRGRRGPP
jgi:EmrB/QacA subfamily drug resistance transporter